jgi:hypothetical protein
MDELRRKLVSWGVGDQPPQGGASRLGHMLASGVEPLGEASRQRFRLSVRWSDLIAVWVGRERVMKPGQHRADGLYLLGILNIEKVTSDHALEGHRDLVDLHLRTAVR